MKRMLFLVLLGAVGAIGVRLFLFEGIYLASDSMAPTMPTGTHVMVNKLIYSYRKPRRGEIVVFPAPQNPKKGLVKRVIAIEGDTIEINKKRVYLNGEMLEEPYAVYKMEDTQFVGDNTPAIIIPEGYIFVMGDNRDFSGDSRDWKQPDGTWTPYVSLDSIEGKVLGVQK